MFRKEFRRSMRNMLRQKEFFIAFCISLISILGTAAISLWTLYGINTVYLRPAWSYWGYAGTWFHWSNASGNMEISSNFMKLYLCFLMPLLASMAYASTHFENCRIGVEKALLPRAGRSAYYRANGWCVFLSGFFIVMVPLILQQLLFVIAAPFTLERNLGSTPLIDDYAGNLLSLSGHLQWLQMAHPYLFNFLTAVCISIGAGMCALCSYTFSLYVHGNKFLVILLIPMLLWFILPVILPTGIAGYARMGVGNYYVSWAIGMLCIGTFNLLFIESKIHLTKDELW